MALASISAYFTIGPLIELSIFSEFSILFLSIQLYRATRQNPPKGGGFGTFLWLFIMTVVMTYGILRLDERKLSDLEYPKQNVLDCVRLACSITSDFCLYFCFVVFFDSGSVLDYENLFAWNKCPAGDTETETGRRL